MLSIRHTIFFSVVLFAGSHAHAAPDTSSFTATYENDVFHGADQGYTNGVRFSWVTPEDELPSAIAYLEDRLVSPASRHFPFFPTEGKQRFSYALGQSMFTPEDIRVRGLQPTSRPYAGWLYGSLGLTSATETALDSLELSVGVVGPLAMAKQTQKFIHAHVTGSADPKGWDNQLKNEPGIVLSYEHKWRHFYRSNAFGLGWDITPLVDASVGNVFTHASTGATVRIGQNIPDDYGPPRIRPSIGGSDFFTSYENFGWYVFAGVEGRAVARNIFLDGNTFARSHSVDKETFVGDLQAGVAVVYRNTRVSFTTVYRTDEYKTQSYPTRFGVLTLTLNY